jgi:hypothetical protein
MRDLVRLGAGEEERRHDRHGEDGHADQEHDPDHLGDSFFTTILSHTIHSTRDAALWIVTV